MDEARLSAEAAAPLAQRDSLCRQLNPQLTKPMKIRGSIQLTNRCLCQLALTAVMFSSSALTANGAVKTWGGGGGSGNWSVAGNWTGGVPPVSGDDVVFQGGAANLVNTNNLPNLRLNSITFTGSGYTVRGNSIVVTNGISGQQASGANTFEIAVTLGAAQTFDCVTAGATQTLSGNITNAGFTLTCSGSGALTLSGGVLGAGGLTKNGTGVLTFSGSAANTYAGPTLVNAGRLDLGKATYNVSIAGSSLTIGDGVGGAGTAIVRDIVTSQIPSTVPITVNSDGELDLNGMGEAIGNSLTLNGGSVDSGANLLGLSANATITVSGSPPIYGSLDIGSGTCTIQGSGILYLYAAVSGTANIVKNGSVSVWLMGANSFSGSFTANNSGYVLLSHNQALGGSNAGLTLNDATYLYINGPMNITNEPLTLNSSYTPTIYTYSGQTNSWSATNFTLLANTSIQNQTNGGLSLVGPIAGTGGLTKLGSGTLTLSGTSANTFTGPTVIRDGLLLLNKLSGQPGIGTGGLLMVSNATVRLLAANQTGLIPVTIDNGGFLDLNGYSDAIGTSLTLNSGRVQTGAGVLGLSAGNTIDIAGVSTMSGYLDVGGTTSTIDGSGYLFLYSAVSGSANLVKNGPLVVWLSGANTFTGTFTANGTGSLVLANNLSLGGANAGTTLNDGARFYVYGGVNITNECLTLNTTNDAAIWLDANQTNSWSATNFTLLADASIQVQSNSVLNLVGPIAGPEGVTKQGPGELVFSGSQANTYVGTTTVNEGALRLNKSVANSAVPGNLVISGTVRLANSHQIADSADVLINPGGLLDFATYYDYIDTLRGQGAVTFGDHGYCQIGAKNGSSTFDGIMSGIGYPGGYTVEKVGTGTFTMNGDNTYSNGTFVNGGKLVINGAQPQSYVRVYSSGSLAGSGTVGDVAAVGQIAPGASPGTLTCSNVAFTLLGTPGSFTVELTGPVAGTDYDQLNVRGTNNLANAVLSLNLAFTRPVAVGQQFTIINNDGTDPITGVFAGYPEGSSWVQNGFKVAISYVGGTGNDVILRLTEVPGASAGYAASSGNGNGTFEPNECASLAIGLTNKTAAPMTGLTATLSSSDPNVLVTQPLGIYPDMPASGNSTNISPFQVSILPSFVCGNPINLQLAVSSASHGSFAVPVVLPSGTPSVTPARYDNNTLTNVPDIGTIESTNTVASWSGGPLTKVAVSLWLAAPWDADLSLTLIAPDGTAADLSSGNGAGANFGTGSADASRTTFDDGAAMSITAGVPPFVGSFRPEGALAGLLASPVVGNWRLRIQDAFGYGSPDTLRAWSLLLYGSGCSPGGGACALCAGGTLLTNTLDATSATMATRLLRNTTISSCAVVKSCPGSSPGNFYYQAYPFYNASSNTCVTVTLTSLGSGDLMSGAYLGEFTPGNVCLNYLADGGPSTAGAGSRSYSFYAPPNSPFTVVVNNVGAPGAYTLTVSGGDCPPLLHIVPLPGPNVQVTWPAVAGGYWLEDCPGLGSAAWSGVVGIPVVNEGRFSVTNTASGTTRFYRLHKP